MIFLFLYVMGFINISLLLGYIFLDETLRRNHGRSLLGVFCNWTVHLYTGEWEYTALGLVTPFKKLFCF